MVLTRLAINYKKVKYIIISPVRNEKRYIRETLVSVINQTIKPLQWIIVDDGSTDDTYNIISKYTENNQWITIVKKDTPLSETAETGSIPKAFLYGINFIKPKDYDFIVKLDGDLSFEENCFQRIFEKFEENPKLGIASGGFYVSLSGINYHQKVPLFNTWGACKIYRKECFKQIGGIIPHLGWDTVDDLTARLKGWETKNFDKVNIRHLKKMGVSGTDLKGRKRAGKAAYFLGYSFLYMIFRFFYRIKTPPFLIGSMAMMLGYFEGFFKCEVIRDKKLVKFVKKEQIKGLLGLKSIWRS